VLTEYRDLPAKQVVPRLADEGCYIGSESTIYRSLRAEGQDAHRGRAMHGRVACAAPAPEALVARHQELEGV
jgi:putative transposase